MLNKNIYDKNKRSRSTSIILIKINIYIMDNSALFGRDQPSVGILMPTNKFFGQILKKKHKVRDFPKKKVDLCSPLHLKK